MRQYRKPLHTVMFKGHFVPWGKEQATWKAGYFTAEQGGLPFQFPPEHLVQVGLIED